MATADNKGEKLKAEGNQLFKEQKYEDAIKKYSEAIQEDDTQAVFFSNRCLFSIRDQGLVTRKGNI